VNRLNIMWARWRLLLGKLGRLQKLFLILLVVYLPLLLAWPGSGLELLLRLVVYVVGFVVACRLADASSGPPSGACAIGC